LEVVDIKKYWSLIYTFIYTFIVLGADRDAPQYVYRALKQAKNSF
jgi:hypothetical protein